MVRLLRLRSPLIIALLVAGAASADSTVVSATAEPSSAPVNAIGSTSQPSAETVLPSMSTARNEHTATLLVDGRVLVAGGSPTFITAELYEPTQQEFRPIADMRYGRQAHTATLLCELTDSPCSNDKVLIAGGVDQSGISLSTAELFIPASATFTLTRPMTTARAGHTATLLKTNHVLIAGGDSAGDAAELFDPVTQTSTRTGTMKHPRYLHAAVRLTDGRVLITGGVPNGDVSCGVSGANTAEIFDPETGRFSPTGTMLQPRYEHTATLISGGNVLITGGQWCGLPLSSAEIYEPASGRFFAIHPMSYARFEHTATALADGTVLIAGGVGARYPQGVTCAPPEYQTYASRPTSAERFDPTTRQFALVSGEYVARAAHTATPLLTGEVLLTGGTIPGTKSCYGALPRAFRVPYYAGSVPTASAETISILAELDALSFTPAAGLTFRPQLVRTSSSAQTATLTNSGSSPVVIKSIAISGDFSQTNTCRSTLTAGAKCYITVTFTPSQTGPRSGSITVTEYTTGAAQRLALSGIGLTSGPNATLSPTSLKFGTQAVGTASSPQTITLSNYGTATLIIKSIAATADFTETNSCGASLASGGSCPIKVRFIPEVTGSVTGRLSVTDNAPGSPQAASLSGTGVGCIPQGHLCYGPTAHCCRVPFPHHAYCSDPTGWGTCVSS